MAKSLYKDGLFLPITAGVCISLIFGLSFVFTRGALTHIDPLHFLALRFLIAALVINSLRLLGIVRYSYRGKKIGPLLLLSLFQPILYFICETVGIGLTSASEGGMVVSLIPIFTVTLAALFLQERPPRPQIVSISISVTGVLLIGVMQAGDHIGGNLLGLLILLGAPLAAGGFSVLSRKLSATFRPLEMTAFMMNVGAVFFTLSAVITLVGHRGNLETFFEPLTNPTVLVALIYLATLSSIVAFFFVNYMLSHLTASQASAFPSLTTLIAVTAGAVILKETLYWFHYLGGILIITGVWGTNYFTRRPKITRLPRKVQGD